MTDFADIRSKLTSMQTSEVVQRTVQQAGLTETQRAGMRQGIEYLQQCGPMPPRTSQLRIAEGCTPAAVLYDAPCTPQLAVCYLFRAQAYESWQLKLRMLLDRRPTDPAQDYARAEWCYDVLETVAQALDATNVRPEFFNEWGVDSVYNAPESEAGPRLFTHVAAFNQSLLGQLRGRGIDDAAILPPVLPSMGGDTESTPESKRPITTRSSKLMPWYVPRAMRVPAGKVSAGTVVIPDRPNAGIDANALRRTFARSPKSYLRYLFRHHPEGGVAPGFALSRKSQSILSTDEWTPAFVLTGDIYMNWCAAWAQDVLTIPLERFVAVGLLEWVRQLTPFYHNGMLEGFPFADVKASIVANARQEAQAAVNTALGAAGTVLAMIPVIGWILALVVVVIQLLLNIILMGADMAAGWSCPLLPFKRTTVSGECSIREIETRSDVDVILQEKLVALAKVTGMESFRRFEQPTPTPQLPPPMPPMPSALMVNEEPVPVPWAKIAVGGTAIVGGALLLRKLRR